MAGGQVEADGAVFAFLLVILLEEAADLMGLDADDGVFLGVEGGSAAVDLDADQVLIEVVAVALKGLFGDEFKEAGFFGRAGEVAAFQNPAELFAFFRERDGTGGRMGLRSHRGFQFGLGRQLRVVGAGEERGQGRGSVLLLRQTVTPG